jgi:hypothetical protein
MNGTLQHLVEDVHSVLGCQRTNQQQRKFCCFPLATNSTPQAITNSALLLLLLLQLVYEMRYRLPKDFVCDRCILQWHYLTGNSCW